MIHLDEMGLPLLVEGVEKVRKESVLSIAWLREMEAECRACAPARGHSILVSGRVRVECEYLPKVDRLTWRVDNRVVDREVVGKALIHARKFKYAPFSDYSKKV